MAVLERFEHEGVEGLRVGRFRMGINTSVVVYRLGGTVIDTGPGNQWQFVRGFLREKPVERVLITHHHEDHGGNGARIKRDMNAQAFAPPSGVACLADGFPLHFYQRVFWGSPRKFLTEALPDEMAIEDGLHVRAILTGGHAPDMTCLLIPERGWLFSGDMFVASTIRYLRADEDLDGILAGLHLLLEHEFDTLFCAHRGVVHDGHTAIRAKLEGLEALRDRARGLERDGMSLREITRVLLGKEDMVAWITQGHYSKSNLVRGLLATGDK